MILVSWLLGGSWDVGRLVIKLVLAGPQVLITLLNFDPSFLSAALLLVSRILPSTSFCMPEIFPATNRWWKGIGEGVGLGRRGCVQLRPWVSPGGTKEMDLVYLARVVPGFLADTIQTSNRPSRPVTKR